MNGPVRLTESRRLYTRAACGSQSVGGIRTAAMNGLVRQAESRRLYAMNGLVRQAESRRLYTKAACGSQPVGWGSLMEECNCKRIDHDKIIKNNQIQDVQR